MQEIEYSRPRYRVFRDVVEQYGPRLSELARSCGLPRSRTRKILNELIESGEVCEMKHRFYVGPNGITTIARQNRNHHQAIRNVITSPPVSNKGHAAIIGKRYRAVNQVKERFTAEGYGVYNGHRMGIGKLKDRAAWFPDLWIGGHRTTNQRGVLPVLVDPSSESENPIKTILREYRAAEWTDPESWTLLVVAKNWQAVKLFLSIGDDLGIAATTLEDILTGHRYSPDRVWLTLLASEDVWDLDGTLLQ